MLTVRKKDYCGRWNENLFNPGFTPGAIILHPFGALYRINIIYRPTGETHHVEMKSLAGVHLIHAKRP